MINHFVTALFFLRRFLHFLARCFHRCLHSALFFKREAVVEKLGSFGEACVRILGMHDDDDEFLAVTDGRCRKAASSRSGVSRLDARRSRIGV